jgi:hypothetical protein
MDILGEALTEFPTFLAVFCVIHYSLIADVYF